MPSPKKNKPVAEAAKTYRLRITLRDVDPPVWRLVEVEGGNTLAQLHDVIQATMGWTDGHLHGFRVGDRWYFPDSEDRQGDDEDTRAVTVAECFARKGSRITYQYDFGDDWEHEIVAEAIAGGDGAVRLPRCLDGARACPPEDCGGAPGYAQLLEALEDPGHPRHEELLEWVGGDLDPEGFDVRAADQDLAGFRREWGAQPERGRTLGRGNSAADPDQHRRQAQRLVRRLFTDVPANDGELRRRLAGTPKGAVRAAVFERLSRGGVRPYQVTLLEAVFSELDLGAVEEALVALVRDSEARAHVRACAFAVLMTNRTERAAAIAEDLGADAMRPVFDEQMRALLAGITVGPGNAGTVTTLVEGIPDEARAGFLATLDRARRSQGFLAHSVYADVVRNAAGAAVRSWALERIAEEKTTAARTLIERLRTAAATPEDRKAAQSAFLGAGPAPGLESGHRRRGQAWLGPCDGAGAFVFFAAIRNPDGTHALANLCIRVSQGIRDGFEINPVRRREFDAMMAEYGRGGMLPLVRAPLGVVAGLARAGRDRTQSGGRGIEPDAVSALARLELVAAIEPPALPAPSPPDADSVRRLLAKPYYDAWWFDAADLKQAGVPAGRSRMSKGFIEKAAAGLDRPAFRERLDGMTRHMALWHALRGEPAEAALLLGCQASLASDFRRSPLLLELIERSRSRGTEPLEPPPAGNSLLRAAIRKEFLGAVEEPAGSDLAILDFCEVVAVCLEAAMQELPDEDHLLLDDQLRLAHAFAGWFLADLRRGQPRKPGGYAGDISAHSGLAPVHAAGIARRLQDAVQDFVLEICMKCPVGCLADPDASVSGPYFSDTHPAAEVLEKRTSPGSFLADIIKFSGTLDCDPGAGPRRKKPRRR